MSKRNLTLGLAVFLVGVMITACGSKKNTSNTKGTPATTQNEIPKNFDDQGSSCEDCTRTYDGTFYIANGAEALYMQAFKHRTQTDRSFEGGTIFEQVLGEMALAVAEPVAGLVVCGARTFLTTEIAKIFGIDNVDVTCSTEELNLFSGTGYGNESYENELASSYASRLRVRYSGGRVEALELTINSNINGQSDREVFYFEESNVFVNRESTLAITNANGQIRFGTIRGQVIGEFRN